ncbi:hypothetical protein [Phocoenobacter skyensis]|uniref:Lipoprotein n=1 Tax=Phocoenobacter skyensis TaxID=97481 RepID=A0A1H7Y1M0_9PAST|nr:hypothetical protein [Pasteurella skyensis]MDP8079793.1 hypothetical protein [Pasteurella skyensis]MDP8085738.1 hypothetical protein [Pasteurella skyensis]MDP8171167.1 hypothetical protein [Pasteurella skyensis]MDP8174998.1 hypothetical protein [Pasteurella skyensis]MDP8185566.1 hypothetical protein [Pasteurella skyensis]
MKKITFLLILIAGFMLTACDKKDACLDSGGSYNETSQKCEK